MPFQLSTLLVYINVITGPFVCSVLPCVASCTPVLCDYASAIFTWVDFCLLLIFWFLCTFISHPFLHFCMFLGVYPSVASTSVYFCWLLSRYLLQHWRLYNGFFLPPPHLCSAPSVSCWLFCELQRHCFISACLQVTGKIKRCLHLHTCMSFTWFFITSYSNIYPSPRELFLTYTSFNMYTL